MLFQAMVALIKRDAPFFNLIIDRPQRVIGRLDQTGVHPVTKRKQKHSITADTCGRVDNASRTVDTRATSSSWPAITFGRAQAIQALFLSWLFSSLSPAVTPDATWSIGPYTVIAGAAMSVFLRSSLVKGTCRLYWPVILTLFLGLFVVLHSVLFSPFKDVSIQGPSGRL
jgi:hypothetical protein